MKKTLDKLIFVKYKNSLSVDKIITLSIFALFSLVVTLCSLPYEIMYFNGNLKLGSKSDKNIIAVKDYYALDLSAYERRKEKVLKGTPIVIDINTEEIENEIERFSEGFKKMRGWSGSTSYESYASVTEKTKEGFALFTRSFSLKGQPFDAFMFLWAHNFSPAIEREMIELIKSIMERGYIESLKEKRKIVKRFIPEYTETYTDESSFIKGEEELKSYVKEWIDKRGSDILKKNSHSVFNFVTNFISVNSSINLQETKKRENETLSKIAPSYIVIKKGELIIRKGELVQQSILDKINIIKREELQNFNPIKLVAKFLIFFFLTVIFYFIASSSVKKFIHDTKSLSFITTILASTLISLRVLHILGLNISFDYNFYPFFLVFFFPFALSGMLLRLFLNTETAIIGVFLMTLLIGLFFPDQYYFVIYVFTSAMLGLHYISHFYTRGELLKAGFKTALSNVFIILLTLFFINEAEKGLTIEKVFLLSGVFISGFMSSLLLIILTPFFEYIFKYTTNITLFELSNLDSPLLKELMIKAPGTYNHSLLIGSLAEAAARAIKVNPLLARVSAYYHDIGKIKKPEFFIENQMSGYNKHEELTPYMSVLVVLSHVKDGVEIAKEHNLGQPIIDAIEQHHGTRLVTYFYAKALKLDPTVKEENFRYLGPKPKTREVGLIMMADAVEAACRVLEDPSPARIKNLVKKIIQDIFLDGQLDECELTLKDLNLVVESFTRTLLGIYHHRVDYPNLKGGKEIDNNKKHI